RCGIMFELVSYNINGHYRGFAQTWEQVAQGIGSDDNYKNELDKTSSFDDVLDELLSGASTQEEKMKIIYKYVKQNIKWNGYDGVYFYNGLKKTLKEKEGNAADINLLLVGMLRYAKINANPVIISTKDNFIPLFPTSDRLNYVIAYAVINDKEYFLDATDEFSNINVMPIRNYNWQGVYIDNPHSRWKLISIDDPEPSTNLYSVNVKLNEQGEAEGKLSRKLTNHFAYKFRQEYKNESKEQYLTKLESEYGGIEIDDYESKNTDTYEGPVVETFDFYLDNAAESSNDKIFIKPLLFLAQDSNPFKSEKREFPIDFEYARKTTTRVLIVAPDGYTVESLPQSVIYQLPDNLGEFKFLCNSNNNIIQVSINFDLNRAYVSPTNYEYIKEFFNQIVAKESEQIILSKQ
ncbi:MAG: transglutaminase domain-containing protein, partial [Mangrovimonas sp.]|nr:transglutaminase domain-containing protein [Mangrovimonas sp.]